MYGNLTKELFLAKVTQKEVAETLGISVEAMSRKTNGKNEFTSGEMFSIKEHYFPDLTLDYLFAKE